MVGVRGSEELSPRARLLCSSARCCWLRGAGAAAHKVESPVRHFAGVAVSPYKMAASTSMQQPQAGPRAAVPGQRLLFASDDFFIQGIVAAPRTQLSCAPTRSLTDEILRGRRHDVIVVAAERVSRCVSRSGQRHQQPWRRCGACCWRAAEHDSGSLGGSRAQVLCAWCKRSTRRATWCVTVSAVCSLLASGAGCRDVRFFKEIGPYGRRKATP